MTTQPAPRSRTRPVLLMGALALAAASIGLVSMMYADTAPFRQPYRQATDAQNSEVMLRIVAAVAGLPLAGALGAAGLLARPATVPVRRALLLLGVLLLLSGLHSCSIAARLPYGFGDSYEHASRAQRRHLDFTMCGGLILMGLAAACWVAAPVARPRRRLPASSLDLGRPAAHHSAHTRQMP